MGVVLYIWRVSRAFVGQLGRCCAAVGVYFLIRIVGGPVCGYTWGIAFSGLSGALQALYLEDDSFIWYFRIDYGLWD